MLARFDYEQARYASAAEMLAPALAAFETAPFVDYVVLGYEVLARSLLALRDTPAAIWVLDHALTLGERRNWPRLLAFTLSERVRLDLRLLAHSDARDHGQHLFALAANHVQSAPCAKSRIADYADLTRARLDAAADCSGAAVHTLRRLGRQAAARHDQLSKIAYGMEAACMLWSVSRKADASRIFTAIVPGAALRGIFQTLLDQGGEAEEIFAEYDRQASSLPLSQFRPYVKLLRERGDAVSASPGREKAAARKEVLSERERVILGLLSRGSSNKRAARELGVSPETVKTHLKHIFEKLEVSKRSQAVFKAQASGLIPSS
jgi:LuxR family maltose regulon positive regulatory protein